jgi:hypothetical protein
MRATKAVTWRRKSRRTAIAAQDEWIRNSKRNSYGYKQGYVRKPTSKHRKYSGGRHWIDCTDRKG